MFKKYKDIRGYSLKDCAAVCLRIVILYYGGDIPLSVLVDRCKTTKLGTNAYNLINTAKDIGFDAEGLKIDFDGLLDFKYNAPFIAHAIVDKKCCSL